MIFHAGANEYTHHPAGYKIEPKNGMYFFAQSDKNQPKLPYETMEFSAPYNKWVDAKFRLEFFTLLLFSRKLHGEDVEIKLGDELPLDINQEPNPVGTSEITEKITEPIPAWLYFSIDSFIFLRQPCLLSSSGKEGFFGRASEGNGPKQCLSKTRFQWFDTTESKTRGNFSKYLSSRTVMLVSKHNLSKTRDSNQHHWKFRL